VSDLVLIGVTLAGLACPAHMLWRMHRGSRGCIDAGERTSRAADVHRRQRSSDHQLAALRSVQAHDARSAARARLRL
jgi:hypothetical protein